MDQHDGARGDPEALRRERAREALAAGDAATALRWIDALPEHARPALLAELWLLVGSVRALAPLVASGRLTDPALHARVAAFVAAPPPRPLPDHDTPDAYERLRHEADRLAALGRAAELTLAHLALSKASPRSDWRAVHIEHAAALAFGLDDPRLSALVRAFEAERDLDFGEHDDALEAARAALAAALAHDEPRAVALAEAVIAAVTAVPHAQDPSPAPEIAPVQDLEPEDL